MPRAAEANCEHPRTRRRTTSQGFEECKRCGGDTSDPNRVREYRLSPRVLLQVDDLVSVSNDGRARERGRFKYAETNPATGAVSLGILTHEKGSDGKPIACGWRFVRPERVRRG